MRGISGFFDKFNNIAIKEMQKRDVIISVILKFTKQIIEMKDISIKEGTVTIKSSQNLKSEIFIKKEKIIKNILKNGVKIVDIK